MIRLFIMIECNECQAIFPDVISVVGSTEVPKDRLHDILLRVEEEGWQSHMASTAQICDDCWHPGKDPKKEPAKLVPF